jgi:uncharacterized protein YceK
MSKKIKLTIEFEVPDEIGETQAEIEQNVFDDVVNHAICSHLEDASNWCCKAKVGTPEVDLAGKMIMDHHNLWADILRSSHWKIEIEGLKNEES